MIEMSDKGTPGKGSQSEEEYFVREDAEKKRRLALQARREKQAAELKALKEQHWMHCPKCGMEMHEVRYRDLDVDTCFSCGGIFLDKDEIDVIAHPRQKGIMAAILNWFKDETSRPTK
jgi:hypothetical protein